MPAKLPLPWPRTMSPRLRLFDTISTVIKAKPIEIS